MQNPTENLPFPENDKIHSCIQEFGEQWHSEMRPNIEDFLIRVGAEQRATLFERLLEIEVQLRRNAGESVERDKYQGRFSDYIELIERVFHRAEIPLDIAKDKIPLETRSFVKPIADETIDHSPRGVLSNQEFPNREDHRYEIIDLHARGGLGVVSLAFDRELKRQVALKEIQNRLADDEDSRARFVLEAKVTGKLEHPGVVPVYSLGYHTDGRPYYAMRFIRGRSLAEAISQFHDECQSPSQMQAAFHSVSFRNLLGRFVDMCNAVAYAHARGILHRDLKPANVMLGEFGETLVVDWGLAKDRSETESDPKCKEQSLSYPQTAGPTQVGSAIGTPAYMPPEQAAGALEKVGPASDVYSLGATLYHLLTNQAPVKGASIGELLRKAKAGDFPNPCSVDAHVPKPLEAICLRAMMLDPADRYGSSQELAGDVERFLADDRVSVYRETASEVLGRFTRRHRVPMQVAVAATILIALVSLGAALITNRARQAESQQRTVAENLKSIADGEKLAAQQAERRERLRLASSYLDNGVALCDDGNVPGGMILFASALHTLPDGNPALERAIRLNLSNWALEFSSS